MLEKPSSQRAGKPIICWKFERQLASVSAQVARLEAERASTEHQVTFAQVLLSLKEEVSPPVESVAAELRAAAVAGSSRATQQLLAIVLFCNHLGADNAVVGGNRPLPS